MSLFRCPNCDAPLKQDGCTYTCPNNHCFDLAKEGYVHLLPANRKNSQNPGDDKEMVAARAAFLSKGYYQGLRQTLANLALTHMPQGGAFFDSGCGEGYYTNEIHRQLLEQDESVSVAGIDISKFAVRLAGKGSRGAEFAVASAYHLPVADGTIDVLLNCFSPLCVEEFHRVLREKGVFFYVVPSAKHLWQLKEAVYDTPYENQEKVEEYPGFSYLGKHCVDEIAHLPTNDDVKNLFHMTPYAWKTAKNAMARLDDILSLDVTIGFHIHVYQKQ